MIENNMIVVLILGSSSKYLFCSKLRSIQVNTAAHCTIYTVVLKIYLLYYILSYFLLLWKIKGICGRSENNKRGNESERKKKRKLFFKNVHTFSFFKSTQCFCVVHTGTAFKCPCSLFLRHNQTEEQLVTEGRRLSVSDQKETNLRKSPWSVLSLRMTVAALSQWWPLSLR